MGSTDVYESELNIFSERLKEFRNHKKMTQKDFADKIGITAAALSAYENSGKNPSVAVVKRISEVFGVSIDWLCGLSEQINIDTNPTTYSDLLKLLIKVSDTEMEFDKWEISVAGDVDSEFGIFRTDNPIIVSFFKEWQKMYELFNDGTIDRHLYTLWLNDRLKQYDDLNLEIDFDHSVPVNPDDPNR